MDERGRVLAATAAQAGHSYGFTFVLLGVDDQVTLWAFALALGAKVLRVFQREVDHPALPRRHRRERVRHLGSAYLFCRNARGEFQFLQPRRTEVHTIEPDAIVLF